MSDGSIIIDTKIDSSGIETGLKGLASKASSIIGTTSKAIIAGTAAATGAVVALTKASVEQYAQYEQLTGGVETLFKDSSSQVMEYANVAYKTAGLSANEYMNTITGFSASLLQGLGGDTKKAAEIGNMAVIDMSDNANKMGTSMESIQNAYQGFAKQNYTMLDNLKLGYGGTKGEMERLLADAEKISGVHYDISNFSDVISAIHVIQEQMGITGTTTEEAMSTIEGSLNMTKAAWQNMLTGMADDNADFDTLVDNLVESLSALGENLLPRIGIALNGVGKLIDTLLPVIIDKIPGMIESALPGILDSATNIMSGIGQAIMESLPVVAELGVNVIETLLQGLTEAMPSIASTGTEVVTILLTGLLEAAPMFLDAGLQAIEYLAEGIGEQLPTLIPCAMECVTGLVQALVDNADVFVEAGADLIAGLAEGLSDAIPGLSAIFDPLKDCFSWIQENAEGITASLIGIGTAMAVFEGYQVVLMFVEAIKSGTLAVKALEIAQAALNAVMMLNPFVLVAAAIAGLVAGLVYLWNTNEGFRNSCIAVWDAIKEKISSVVSWFSNLPGKMAEVGRNIVAGIKNGIANAWESICSWFKGKVKGLIDAAKSALDIHSPSRKFRDLVGKFIPLGIVEGIKATTGDLIASATNMAQAVINAVQEPFKNKNLAESMVAQFRSASGTYEKLADELNSSQENYDWWSKRKVDDNEWYASAKSNLDAIKDKIKELKDAKTKDNKDSIEAEIKAWEQTQKEAEKEVEYYKKAAQEEIDANKLKYKIELNTAKEHKKQLETLIKGLTSAIKEQLSQQKEAAISAIDSELSELENRYNRESDRIDETSEKRKNRIQSEIDKLDEEKEAEDRLKEVQEANNNIAVLQAKMNNTASEADKKAYALKIKNAKAALEAKKAEWDRTDEKARLKEEQDEIEERAKRKKERLKADYEEEKEALEKKKKATEEYYETLLETDNLNAQVRYRMLNDSNEQLVQLLNSYAPYWQDAGQSLADSLINGLNSKREDMAHAVASMTELRGSLTGYASGTSYNRLSGLYNVDEKGFELSTNNNPVAYVSKGAGILSHMQSLQAIDKAVKSRVSEQMQALKNLVLGQQQQMYQLAGAMAGVVNNSSSIREGDINFNVEHYHNDRKDSIKETAEELGFYAKRKKRC